MKKVELIFVPMPEIGHLVSIVEFAKLLIDHNDRIRVTILSMKWFPDAALDAYTKSLTALPPDGIQLIDLPRVDPPSLAPWKSAESVIDAFIKCYIPLVRNAVRDIVSMKCSSDETRIAGLVLDLFCSPMVDVATDFDLPSYIFITSNAAFVGLMSEFQSSDPEHVIPGLVNPVPTYVLPSAVFSKDEGYAAYVKVAERFKDAKGIIINTFEEVEHYALNCFSNGQNPPVYPVGPVINFNGLSYSDSDDKVMKWLDDQPQSSVVFLCFGSMGSFKAPQVKETALGLEQSGFRFLWSLRVQPPQNDASKMLPEGFLERVQGRGMICRFISHCGWNSILGSLWFGVPIVTWPLYAEQQVNAYKMVKELGLAVEMRLNYRKDSDEVVMADEIEKAVGMVMDGRSEMRKKVKEMGEMARKSVMEGGTSVNSIGKLIEDMIGNN
ncbi:hypothetical protein ES319_A03G061400v1 [Gossypium barbadense]|uniref:Glycosyltransferase n=1 Tax=Gossypium barbadense TaxID=3634 RepID=A0A5J5WDZ9_GOSBA|nr:hypothetical protein ES319_A03G061400v1 [Gossypium barbadense]